MQKNALNVENVLIIAQCVPWKKHNWWMLLNCASWIKYMIHKAQFLIYPVFSLLYSLLAVNGQRSMGPWSMVRDAWRSKKSQKSKVRDARRSKKSQKSKVKSSRCVALLPCVLFPFFLFTFNFVEGFAVHEKSFHSFSFFSRFLPLHSVLPFTFHEMSFHVYTTKTLRSLSNTKFSYFFILISYFLLLYS
jgi:hypothetical protein